MLLGLLGKYLDDPYYVATLRFGSLNHFGLGLLPLYTYDSVYVALGTANEDSAGIQGVAAIKNDRLGLVLGDPLMSTSSRRFAQATALGHTLTRTGQGSFLLSAAHRDDGQVSRAFAAELLAPAAGIRQFLDRLGRQDDLALKSTARHFGVSPILIRHQYDNQAAHTS